MVKAQIGVQQAGRERGLPGARAPVLPFQIGEHAALPVPRQQVLDLEQLTAARPAGQAEYAGQALLHHAVQPPRNLPLHDERAVWAARRPVEHRQSLPARDRPTGKVFQRQRLQHKLAPRQRVRLEQAGKPPLPGESRQILLHIAALRQEKLHRQRDTRAFAGHIVLQVGEQLFIFAVEHSRVRQYHAVLLERIQTAALEQTQQRDIRSALAPQPQGDRRLRLPNLSALLRLQFLLQPHLGGSGELVLELLARHHQPEHVFHLARWAEPLMVRVKIVQPQVEPHEQVAHQRPLAVIPRAGRQVDRPDFLRPHRVSSFYGVLTVTAGVIVT